MTTHAQKCERFAELHAGPETFVIPNPWDVGSAKILEGLGFEALATTSAGVATALGTADGAITLEQKLAHCAELAAATTVPINADFENGFARAPEDVADNILRVAETGVAGCSVEDFDRDDRGIYEFELAVERVHAAAEAVAGLGMPFQLTARAENLLRGVDDLEDTIRRLQAFSAAGAHVLYAPGVASLEVLRRVSGEIDKPFNVLSVFFVDVSVDEFAEAGARRISVGSALGLVAWNALIRAGREMIDRGTFGWTAEMASGVELQKLLA